jgi:ankyrin repeat protein
VPLDSPCPVRIRGPRRRCQARAPTDLSDVYGQILLCLASIFGHEQNEHLLLQNADADVATAEDEEGRTPLCWSSALGHALAVCLLLKQPGVDADYRDVKGRTPLTLAVTSEHGAVLQLLLSADDIDTELREHNG